MYKPMHRSTATVLSVIFFVLLSAVDEDLSVSWFWNETMVNYIYNVYHQYTQLWKRLKECLSFDDELYKKNKLSYQQRIKDCVYIFLEIN